MSFQLYTPTEQKVHDAIIDAHNEFTTLPSQHPNEMKEWVSHIHALQSLLALRAIRNHFPDQGFNKIP